MDRLDKLITTEPRIRHTNQLNDLFDGETSKASFLERFSNILSITIVTLGFALIGWYGYKLHSKPINPVDLPVIQSDASPNKIKPSDPGGMVVLNMDKTIYENVSSSKNVKQNDENVLPMPEAPIDRQTLLAKAKENMEVSQLEQQAEKKRALVKEEPQHNESIAQPNQATPENNSEALVPQDLSQEIAKVKESQSEAALKIQQPQAVQLQAPAENDVIKYEPVAIQKQPSVKSNKKPKIEKAKQITEPTTPQAKGKFKVQIAAFRSQNEAKHEWDKLKKKHAKILAKYKPTIEKKVLKGTTFYRLQITNIGKQQDAYNLCKTLIGVKQGCFVIK
jgi:hypothetical protein